MIGYLLFAVVTGYCLYEVSKETADMDRAWTSENGGKIDLGV